MGITTVDQKKIELSIKPNKHLIELLIIEGKQIRIEPIQQ